MNIWNIKREIPREMLWRVEVSKNKIIVNCDKCHDQLCSENIFSIDMQIQTEKQIMGNNQFKSVIKQILDYIETQAKNFPDIFIRCDMYKENNFRRENNFLMIEEYDSPLLSLLHIREKKLEELEQKERPSEEDNKKQKRIEAEIAEIKEIIRREKRIEFEFHGGVVAPVEYCIEQNKFEIEQISVACLNEIFQKQR